MAPEQLNDDAFGRALETLYAYGVTALYSLIAATAAEHLGLAPRFGHLDRTSFHVDGRDNSAEEPEAQVVRGSKHSPRWTTRRDRCRVMPVARPFSELARERANERGEPRMLLRQARLFPGALRVFKGFRRIRQELVAPLEY
jgi:Domain of unknown function (DUF4277)